MLSQKDEILSWSSARFVPESIADKKLPLAANKKQEYVHLEAGFQMNVFFVFIASQYACLQLSKTLCGVFESDLLIKSVKTAC